MEQIRYLKSQVYSSPKPERALLITYVKLLAAQASKLPVTQRDWYAYEILRPFIELDISLDDDPELDQIVFQYTGGELDVNTEDVISMSRTQAEKDDRYKRKAQSWQNIFDELSGVNKK